MSGNAALNSKPNSSPKAGGLTPSSRPTGFITRLPRWNWTASRSYYNCADRGRADPFYSSVNERFEHGGAYLLVGHIKANVAPGSQVFTNQFNAYEDLHKDFGHRMLNHLKAYLNGASVPTV